MLQFICLFFPSFVSLLVDAKIATEKTTNEATSAKTAKPLSALLLKYPIYVIVNNLIILILILVKNRHSLPLTVNIFTVDFLILYLIISTFVAFFTPFIGKYVFTNFTINYAQTLPKEYQPKKRKWFRFKIDIKKDRTESKNTKAKNASVKTTNKNVEAVAKDTKATDEKAKSTKVKTTSAKVETKNPKKSKSKKTTKGAKK